jgi:uncharacterized RDD family membrane protein YckC
MMAEEKKKLNYAGFVDRLIAYIIDSLVVVVPLFVAYVILFILAITIRSTALAILSMVIPILIGIVIAIYNNIYLIATKGASIGKKFMKLKVVDLGGKYPIGYGRTLLREIVGKFVSGIILCLGYLLIIIDEKKQGLHDKIAGTYVIKE